MNKYILTRIRTKAKRKWLTNLLGNRCSICGDTYRLYDFHHKGEDVKSFTIGTSDSRISTLLREAKKCELLCRNCHRDKHAPFDSLNLTHKNEIKIQLLNHIGTCSCIKCGYSKNVSALDFHHIDPSTKNFDLSDAVNAMRGMIVDGNITDIVKAELGKCVVLCAQCHAEEHYDFDFDVKYADEIEYHSNHIKEIQPKLDRDIVKSKFENGMRIIDIANELKASKGTICDILKSFGLTTTVKEKKEKAVVNKKLKKEKAIANMKARRKFDPSIEEAIELKKVMSCREIGSLFGVSHVAVYKRFIKMGILEKK